MVNLFVFLYRGKKSHKKDLSNHCHIFILFPPQHHFNKYFYYIFSYISYLTFNQFVFGKMMNYYKNVEHGKQQCVMYPLQSNDARKERNERWQQELQCEGEASSEYMGMLNNRKRKNIRFDATVLYFQKRKKMWKIYCNLNPTGIYLHFFLIIIVTISLTNCP